MTKSAYDAFDDPYCYPDTHVLRNKAELYDPDDLEAFELEMTALRADEPLPSGNFDPQHYSTVHHHIFQDVYEWAGQYRTVRTAKDGNVFCYPEYIQSMMNGLFESMSEILSSDSQSQFLDQVTDFLAELNAIHPFREGNGRAQLTFIDMIACEAGFPFDFRRIERETFMPAMIESFAGDTSRLRQELALLQENQDSNS